MPKATEKKCCSCEKKLSKDEIGLNKKLFEAEVKKHFFMCLHCMANFLECSEEDLYEKIEEFKAEGCKLFS